MSDQDKPADPYALVIADLRAKREYIDRAIEALEAFRSAGPIPGQPGIAAPSEGQRATRELPEVEPGSFLGMTIAEAVKTVLAAQKKAQTTTALTNAILHGGVVLQSENPKNTVGSVLNRQAKTVGDIVSVGRGMWGLSAWYPNPGRFAKKRDNDKGEGDAAGSPPVIARESVAPPTGQPTTSQPPAVSKSASGGPNWDDLDDPPKGGDLDDEIPF